MTNLPVTVRYWILPELRPYNRFPLNNNSPTVHGVLHVSNLAQKPFAFLRIEFIASISLTWIQFFIFSIRQKFRSNILVRTVTRKGSQLQKYYVVYIHYCTWGIHGRIWHENYYCCYSKVKAGIRRGLNFERVAITARVYPGMSWNNKCNKARQTACKKLYTLYSSPFYGSSVHYYMIRCCDKRLIHVYNRTSMYSGQINVIILNLVEWESAHVQYSNTAKATLYSCFFFFSLRTWRNLKCVVLQKITSTISTLGKHTYKSSLSLICLVLHTQSTKYASSQSSMSLHELFLCFSWLNSSDGGKYFRDSS